MILTSHTSFDLGYSGLPRKHIRVSRGWKGLTLSVAKQYIISWLFGAHFYSWLECLLLTRIAITLDTDDDDLFGIDTVETQMTHDNMTARFTSARPIWPAGREKEMNLLVGFRAVVKLPSGASRGDAVLRVAASTIYRAFVDGRFVGHGPAVGPHGFYRLDECPLDALGAGEHVVAIEVASYNVNGFYVINQPGFVQAEMLAGGRVLAFTGDGFEARILPERIQKVQRTNFQRPFVEGYAMSEDFDRWRSDPSALRDAVSCQTQDPKALLPRRVNLPRFEITPPRTLLRSGESKAVTAAKPWRDKSLAGIDAKLLGFTMDQLDVVLSDELQAVGTAAVRNVNSAYAPQTPLDLAAGEFHILDFGTNLTGFVAAQVTCLEPTRLYFSFDERLIDGDVHFLRSGMVAALRYDLAPGTYRLESLEPHEFRFLKLAAAAGRCRIENIFLRQYACPDVWDAHFASSDPALDQVFRAGRETFRQNAVDFFMDCPGRERAGWLCDGFFTSRAAADLTGNALIETNFFENFLLPKKFEFIPEGMLPMCYPADHNDGVFIPNWAMWFVLQLGEYVDRGGDRELVEALRPRVLALLEYLAQFHNSDGLLEKLPGWVFIDWSEANNLGQDVNYPTNLTYAVTLDIAGALYGKLELQAQARQVRRKVLEQSFDGEFFVDNAVRKDGRLEPTRKRTESCQYYAMLMGNYLDEPSERSSSLTTLRQRLIHDFGPLARRQTPNQYYKGLAPTADMKFPEIYPCNMIVGNMLRLELLSRLGRRAQVARETAKWFLPMAQQTGTLWEHDSNECSCNHGFASNVVHLLYRDVLGVREIDHQNKVITVCPGDGDLAWCEGTMPVGRGLLRLKWRRDGDKIAYQAQAPEGYTLSVLAPHGAALIEERP